MPACHTSNACVSHTHTKKSAWNKPAKVSRFDRPEIKRAPTHSHREAPLVKRMHKGSQPGGTVQPGFDSGLAGLFNGVKNNAWNGSANQKPLTLQLKPRRMDSVLETRTPAGRCLSALRRLSPTDHAAASRQAPVRVRIQFSHEHGAIGQAATTQCSHAHGAVGQAAATQCSHEHAAIGQATTTHLRYSPGTLVHRCQ
eukprot:361207-Chlamydomonas_euryale.AAC.8